LSRPRTKLLETARAFGRLPTPVRDLAANVVAAATLLEMRCDSCSEEIGQEAFVACVELSNTRTSVVGRWLCRACSPHEVGVGESFGPFAIERPPN